jgi:hypothetical protein
MRPRVLYATSGGVSIAYQVVGSGAIDLVFQPGFVSHLDLAWEEHVAYAPPAVTTMSVANPAASPSRTPQWSSSLRPFLCATPSS